jgi:phosphohistidine phosphatase
LKTLFLVRHAKSSWSDATRADCERPLAERGHRAARKMGKRLARRNVRPDLMRTSPARRALKTARLIARRLHHRRRNIQIDRALYEATAKGLLRNIRGLHPRHGRVMLFGHNPSFAQLACYFSRQEVAMPTCAVACFQFDVDAWADVGPKSLTCAQFDYPRKGRR